MRLRKLTALLGVLPLLGACGHPNSPPLDYPQARRSDHVDDYFGVAVPDPYRWMEDLDSEEVQEWVAAQNAIARPWLESIPAREAIRQRTEELWSYRRWEVPVQQAGLYFYEANDGLQNQNVLYVTEDLGSPGRVLIDPNSLSDDGTIALVRYDIRPDGRYLAYSLSDGGSDWTSLHVRRVDTGEDLDDVLTDIKFTHAAWSGDGFFYGRYPAGEGGQADGTQAPRIFYHHLGTPQTQDALVWEVTDHPGRLPFVQVSDDGRYLLLYVIEGYFQNGLYYRDLSDAKGKVVRLFDDWDGRYEFLGNRSDTFYVQTTAQAPNGRVLAVDLRRPQRRHWREVVPEADFPIRAASLAGDHVVLHYLEDAHSVVRLVKLDGTGSGEIPLPGLGTVYGADTDKPASGDEWALSGQLGESEIFYGFSSYTRPPSVWRYDLASGQNALVHSAETAFQGDAYTTRQVLYDSHDGTRVPMFLTHRQEIELDGDQPTLLYGYGGFAVAKTPVYSTAWAVWLEMGGVLAVANLRGGGEYGEAWHQAGLKSRKQNVFDDFIAAAEWLIDHGYTRPERLAALGGSNGGLLVAASMLQRPDLFGAVVPAVGVLDMLRYHTASSNARQWASDYGLSENEEDFRAQVAYSPYHNVKQGTCYPPTLISTADHDDRVAPWHSFKFAAALQAAQDCDNPILIRIETRVGHGAGKPTWIRIEEVTDRYAFLHRALDMAQ